MHGAIQGIRVHNTSTAEVWRKQLASGEVAVVLLNLGEVTANITAHWIDIGLPVGAVVSARDLWKRQDLPGTRTEMFTAEVPSHGTAFVKLTPRDNAYW